MSDNKEVLINIENLKKTYAGPPKVEVLKSINLKVYKNEILAITGESGSGKTTLLNLIGGIDDITEGSIDILGNNIGKMNEGQLAHFRNSSLGYVFQFHNLLGEFSALENVMIPSLMLKYNKKEARQKAEVLLETVGLKDRMEHRIGELSGGEAQRVAIARALINRPSVVLADEPTGNLDKKNAEMVRELLWNMTKQSNASLIIVTHSVSIANMADRKLRLEYGENLIEY
ncbi:ABC transporter ATP-binding protein [Brachyspira hyodysenteriae]|uniref:Lipoprotein releasing system, ATP-binding protein n=2 Tax=Brachyspira hyodysenteriae TaxID=159 RepID=A0A3B6V8F1_BRAHW|nr:ABC transporter ATP-binding protein [Brachyspira hyodysenteriae]ACN82675.1 lipoprotein releasing system, ATP-binding protein [Brachyspira hyodysenteriae WA1]ANN62695.1 lipoprotein ABC transporter ATP-binding protein [Brachyspira hyodysenteriae ATCC 27164]AUJ50999.1 lipoprotein releasing system, ATP-binding protein [Brachyspira hyodysenteriae]KLI13276.1 lipoprotein ABC transporter ATP-binding protein [Brachyspira hyodysenteriae]KLI14101.1 lipoprotein ABC transporter ATP-binding protein [Brac